MESPWHSIPVARVLYTIETSGSTGLTDTEVKRRKARWGPNSIPSKKEWYLLKLIFDQFKSPLVIILLAAGFITLVVLQDIADALIIGIAILINTSIGVFQEGRASRAFETLRKTLQKTARVFRDGALKEIPAEELVPGDIIEVEAGMSIHADARIVSSRRLVINEASLTGEWIGQDKNPTVLPSRTALFDRANMLFAGTLCETGIARAVVVATGTRTEFGRIALSLQGAAEAHTPFQKSFIRLSRYIGAVVVMIAIIFFVVGVLRGEKAETMFLTSVALAVSAVPEGLPIAMTVILALGMERILKRGGLLKRLKSAETLGSATVILTDKTGTLTRGTMEVSHVIPVGPGDAAKLKLMLCGTLTSAAFIENPDAELSDWKIRGESTDVALLMAGHAAGISKKDFELENIKIDFLPFDTQKRYAAAIYRNRINGQYEVFVSGAPETVLALSHERIKDKNQIEKSYMEMAHHGSRMIACAHAVFKKLPTDTNALFKNMDFLGFIGFHDPLRPDARYALEVAQRAGIRPVIVTGDHRLTAQKIAREIAFDGKDKNIVEGSALESGDVDITKVDIFARVLPHQKLLIVEAWQKRGEIVAMTGDGVNDAPALKEADIGIALGSGTDVAKEAADLVLLDNSFSTITAAIEEGRTIVDNVRKIVTFLLATGFTEVVLIGGALILGMPLPILPSHILWINLVGEGFFNFAFAFEKKEADVLLRKPTRGKLFTREMKALIFAVGLLTDFFLLGVFLLLSKTDLPLEVIRTIIFAGLAIDSFFFVFSLRSMRRPVWKINFFSNPYLLFAAGASAVLLVPTIIFPPFQKLIHTVPLSSWQWGVIIALGLVDLIFIEAVKYYFIARGKTN